MDGWMDEQTDRRTEGRMGRFFLSQESGAIEHTSRPMPREAQRDASG